VSTQEFAMQVFQESLASLHPKTLTVDQMQRLLRAIDGKEAAYRAEIEARTQAEINRKALTGMNWSAA